MTDFIKGEIAGTVIVAAIVAYAIACGQLLHSERRVAEVPTPDAGVPCPICPSTAELVRDLSACETKVKVIEQSSVKTRVVPRACASDPPEIASVQSTECADGKVCLDAMAQRALAKNLAAYESWITKVRECESKPLR